MLFYLDIDWLDAVARRLKERRSGISDREISKKGVLLITEEQTGRDLDVSKILEKIDIIKGIRDLSEIDDEGIDLPRGF